MKPVRNFILGLLFVLGTYPSTVFSIPIKHLPANDSPQRVVSDITVGQRTNDSTGQLSISNSAIQQSILPAIAFLNNTTLTSDNSSLLVFQNMAYLLFNVTDTNGVKSRIAIQLNGTDSADFIFHPQFGMEIHILRNSSNCTSCSYFRDQGSISVTNCNADDPCKHLIHFSM